MILNETSYFGAGCRETIAVEAARRGFKKAFFVTDRDLIRFKVADKVIEVFEKNSIPYELFSDVKANPTITNVQNGVAAFKASGADFIVALGGGSSIDTAKGIGIVVNNPDFADVKSLEGVADTRQKAVPTFALPTTAGTAAEVTINYVIIDEEVKKKMVCVDPNDIPAVAIVDPELMYSMPKGLTAATGMDALTHAVEAYIGGSTTKETRAMAEEAVCLIHEHLKNAYDNGHNKEARKGMLRAAYCAGVAFTKSYVGYIHAVAHSLGGQYGTPHGLANAVILPIVLRIYGPDCEKKLGTLARNTGVAKPEMDDAKATQCFIDWIQKMNDSMGIPRYFPEICKKDIPIMAKHADKEANPLYPVPVLMDRKELEKIYLAVRGKTW